MTIERARVEAVLKPWGVDGVSPWTAAQGQIGEVWFERADEDAEPPVLQLKLLFTSQPLSIQVHPNDEQAIEAGAALRANNLEDGLKLALEIIHSPARRKAMGEAGRDFARSHRGATTRTLALLAPLLRGAQARKR